jgi:serine/threonine-protein kinase
MTVPPLLHGRYRLDEPIGHGGMALVHRGYDTALDRVVAVKLLADNLTGDEECRRRFVREARLAAALAHPNIVRVFDAGEQDGRPFIVMEHVAGESLRQLLAREQRLDSARAVDLAVQACAGLQHAHDRLLVHRDVKPHNLLLGADGILKIADFGIARPTHGTQLTLPGGILGTAAYLAPEQAAGDEATAASDVYALGLVVYELLTGSPPYAYKSLADRLRAPREPAPPLRVASGVPPALEREVLRALELDPRDRPPSARSFAAALQAALPGTASAGEAPTVPLRRGRPRQRTAPAVLAAAAAAVAVAGATLAVVLTDGSSTSAPARKPAAVAPATSGTAVEQADRLTRWLRARSAR